MDLDCCALFVDAGRHRPHDAPRRGGWRQGARIWHEAFRRSSSSSGGKTIAIETSLTTPPRPRRGAAATVRSDPC
jgi:hypothetical protein